MIVIYPGTTHRSRACNNRYQPSLRPLTAWGWKVLREGAEWGAAGDSDPPGPSSQGLGSEGHSQADLVSSEILSEIQVLWEQKTMFK